ncbi:hypothetical protein Syun_028951 [Stephania yunnanensis]|uniref:Replication protein A 70 kDa DNA-binding subunit B/D first OB fold domain-containing protein n=1 Tax=Stephania yunnanensis TaxID=152371 RepID=A0AAP0E818_9MAGN
MEKFSVVSYCDQSNTRLTSPEMEYTMLDDLRPTREDWVVRVRISRLWESQNLRNNNEVISLDMILIDEQECEFTIKAKVTDIDITMVGRTYRATYVQKN